VAREPRTVLHLIALLVDYLLSVSQKVGRGADGDVAEAEVAIERLAAAPADEGLVIRDVWLLRLRALLARAHSDVLGEREWGPWPAVSRAISGSPGWACCRHRKTTFGDPRDTVGSERAPGRKTEPRTNVLNSRRMLAWRVAAVW
jgi:hypothetical protein